MEHNNNENFQEFCNRLNEICREHQDLEKEVVSDELAFEAYVYAKNMRLLLPGDALLFCAALNLLNTYVKQKNNLLGYKFKRELGYLLGSIYNLDIQDILLDLQKDNGMNLLVVQIESVQFSFHCIHVTRELGKYLREHRTKERLIWDGIRKQKCAVTLYSLAKSNMILCSGETYRGKDLEKKATQFVEHFVEGKISFKNLK